MELRVEHVGDVSVCYLKGNAMGGPDGTQLYEKLNEEKQLGRVKVALVLKDVKFMNSSGIGMLISGLTTMQNAGGDLRLVGVPEKIKSLLTITRLATVFQSFDTLEEAIASFA